MPKASDRSTTPIYQLKITLRESKPPIWRRVLVPGNFTLMKLHYVIQAAMGWTDSHLHQYRIDGEDYGTRFEDFVPDHSEQATRLAAIAPHEKRKFAYEYDFGDSWEHDILVEKILPPDPSLTHPVCLAGKRACPPEDVGGVWGYEEFLAALDDPDDENHDSYKEWIGGSFDAKTFDLDAANRRLKTIRIT